MARAAPRNVDLTNGPVRPQLLRLASMIFVGMVAQTLYMLIDLYWVGHLGGSAIAAVGLAGNLLMLVMALTQILSVGTAALVSHAAGAGDGALAQRYFGQSQSLAAAGAVMFLVVALGGRDLYARSLSADADTLRDCQDYLVWFIPSLALNFPMMAMGSALRGAGDLKPGMVVQLLTVALNIVLAPVLIFGWLGLPAMGVAGAGLSTFIAVLVGVRWLGRYFRATDGYLRWQGIELRPDLAVWRRLFGIGLPSGGEFLLMFLYSGVVFALARAFGPAAQAGYGVGVRVLQAGFLPGLAVSFAAAAVAGQSFGARNPQRLRETFIEASKLSLVYMTVLLLLFHFWAEAMLHPFTQDPAVVAYGAEFLRVIAWNLLATAIIFSCGAIFQGMGHTWPSLLASGIRVVIVVAPGVWLSRRPGFELAQLWYLSVFSTVVQLVLNVVFLRASMHRRMPLPAET